MTHLETVSVDRHAHHNVPAVIEAFTSEELEIIEKGKSAQDVLDGGIFRLFEIYDAIMVLKWKAPTKFAFADCCGATALSAMSVKTAERS